MMRDFERLDWRRAGPEDTPCPIGGARCARTGTNVPELYQNESPACASFVRFRNDFARLGR